MNENEKRSSGASPSLSNDTGSGRNSADAKAEASIHDRTGLYISIIALVLAGIALGIALMVPRLHDERSASQESRIALLADRAEKAEREARVMQERWNDLKVELARRGIPTSDH